MVFDPLKFVIGTFDIFFDWVRPQLLIFDIFMWKIEKKEDFLMKIGWNLGDFQWFQALKSVV